MYEKRLTQRLTRYWDSLKKDNPMPPFQKFNVSAIDDVWDYCLLIAVSSAAGQTPNYNYYRLGKKVQDLYGSDVSGQPVRPEQSKSRNASIIKRIGEVLANPTPLYDDGQFVNAKHKVVKYRSCLLPFGQNGEVTHVVVGLSWREFG